MEREPGIFVWKKNDASKKKLRIASESEKVFERIFGQIFRCPGLPKTSVFEMDKSNYIDLDPSPCISMLRIILFSHKKVYLIVIVNIKVYKRNI